MRNQKSKNSTNNHEWKKNLTLYHITTPDKVPLIERSGGLKGSKKSIRNNLKNVQSLSQDGFIYTTTYFNKKIWDGIRNNQIFKSVEEVLDFGLNLEREYVVYMIKGSSFVNRGFTDFYVDNNEGLLHQGLYVKINVGNRIIPLNEMVNLGRFNCFENGIHRIDKKGRFLDRNGDFLNEPNIKKDVESKFYLNTSHRKVS